jgi:lysozyme
MSKEFVVFTRFFYYYVKMKVSEEGKKFLILNEGEILKIYLDSAGLKTCGVGHLIIKDDPEYPLPVGTPITKERSDELLTHDLKIVEDCINNYVDVDINLNMFNALASFIFNIGINGFIKSTLLKELNQEHYAVAVNEFAKWSKITKDGQKIVSPGILARRQREKALFEKPIA